MTIGRINKPICAIITSLVLILGTFAIVLPYQEAEADHVKVFVAITLTKNDAGHIFYGPIQVFCGVVCEADLNLNNRDDKRFSRWCPSDPQNVVVTAGNTLQNFKCNGKGPWDIVITVTLRDTGGALITHPTSVTAIVTAS